MFKTKQWYKGKKKERKNIYTIHILDSIIKFHVYLNITTNDISNNGCDNSITFWNVVDINRNENNSHFFKPVISSYHDYIEYRIHNTHTHTHTHTHIYIYTL